MKVRRTTWKNIKRLSCPAAEEQRRWVPVSGLNIRMTRESWILNPGSSAKTGSRIYPGKNGALGHRLRTFEGMHMEILNPQILGCQKWSTSPFRGQCTFSLKTVWRPLLIRPHTHSSLDLPALSLWPPRSWVTKEPGWRCPWPVRGGKGFYIPEDSCKTQPIGASRNWGSTYGVGSWESWI